MASRYFFTERASRPFQINGREYRFTPTDTVGVQLIGVYEAADDQAVADLLSFVGRGVVEITLDDFQLEKKRTKPHASNNSSALRLVSLPVQQSPDSPAQPAPPAKPDPDQAARIISIADVVRVGPVHSPSPIVSSDDRVSKT